MLYYLKVAERCKILGPAGDGTDEANRSGRDSRHEQSVVVNSWSSCSIRVYLAVIGGGSITLHALAKLPLRIWMLGDFDLLLWLEVRSFGLDFVEIIKFLDNLVICLGFGSHGT